jgi:hypothetical protein
MRVLDAALKPELGFQRRRGLAAIAAADAVLE